MKMLFFFINNFLILFLTISGCKHNSNERPEQIDVKHINSINEKNRKSKIIWTNESHGYFIDTRDNKKYRVIKIGTQTWFAENLAYKPKNGDSWAYNNNKNNIAKYGYLYFWETAKNACPAGWHLPNNEEWNILINFLGGETVAGGKLKATVDWNSPNKGATNSSEFNAKPGGNRAVGGSFYHLGDDALFWSSTPDGVKSAWKIRLNYNNASVGFEACSRLTGRSVRCIMD